MENTQPNPNVPKRNLKPYLLVGVFIFVALVSLYFAYRAFLKTKTTPPEFRKVSAVVGTDITVTIKTDGGGMFFEHNGQRLSPTNRITDLMPGTEYTLTIVNGSQVKQGVFIPALAESIAVEPTQSAKISMTFTNPGTYYFLGNVFQPDWDGLKSGFDVGMDTIVTPSPTSPAAGVPAEFQDVYTELDGRLTAFESYLDGGPDAASTGTVYAAELLPANGNRGEALLQPNSLAGNLLYLDKLVALGVEGVTIQMPYPVLSDDFPRSQEYWAFYRSLTQAIKGRGLRILAKSGPVFTEDELSSVYVDYSLITLDEYFNGRKEIAKKIVTELAPDYLTIANEPSTEIMITGKTGITEARYTQFVNETLQEIDRSFTLIGAGSGSWDDTGYVESFAQNTTVDYIDIHIYPLASTVTDYLMRASEMIDLAQTYNKKVVLGEMWLYKSAASELTGVPTHVEMFGRDTFEFWAPLDQKMLSVMAKLAQSQGIEYVSPFWTRYFFAYLEYEPNKLKTPAELLALADAAAVNNILANEYSSTGLHYKAIIDAAR